jgi:phosphoenolpyruvate carboxykinase (ATP)
MYAQQLIKKMKEHGSTAYLVNTGWIGGPYGVGKRIDIPPTRAIIDAILDGSLDNAEYTTIPVFDLQIPKSVKNVDPNLLDQRSLWTSSEDWLKAARELGLKFIKNFEGFTDSEEGKRLIAAGPRI